MRVKLLSPAKKIAALGPVSGIDPHPDGKPDNAANPAAKGKAKWLFKRNEFLSLNDRGRIIWPYLFDQFFSRFDVGAAQINGRG